MENEKAQAERVASNRDALAATFTKLVALVGGITPHENGCTCDECQSDLADFIATRLANATSAAAMVPGRWFRVLAPDGSLWMETSDGDEARAEARKTGWPLERLYVSSFEEWRRES